MSEDLNGHHVARLLAARNTDGGWGYAPGKKSRLEPTCLALLALGQAGDAAVLARWPHHEGLLIDGHGLPPNHAGNGLAVLTWLHLAPQAIAQVHPLVRALVAVTGRTASQSDIIRMDASLRAWPWIADTFSWVEPTAWCMLALKRWRRLTSDSSAHARLDEAERMLVDRALPSGGWNYGNTVVYGKELHAYVPTTALALLALQDRRHLPAVERGVRFLREQATTEASALSMGLAAVALRVFGQEADTLEVALAPRLDVAAGLGQLMGLAVGLYAVVGKEQGYAAVRL